jgi:uncharacterized protein YbjT (DUF2867 family)
MLATELRARGHAVRGTTRDPASVAAIEATGAEAVVGDPDRLATLTGALEHVTVAYLLLGSAVGERKSIEALHGVRLEALLHRMLDTTVHAVAYEASGSVDPRLLERGGQIVTGICEKSRIPFTLLRGDGTGAYSEWSSAAADALDRLLAPAAG